MTTSAPLVSVIIAAYEAADTLERCVASVLAQTHENLEIIIIDDKSTDRTVQVAESLLNQDTRIKLVKKEKNSGPGATRNKGLDIAQGEWIMIVDSDDTITPERTEKMLTAARNYNADIVFDNLLYIPIGKDETTGYAYLPDQCGAFGDLPFETYIISNSSVYPLKNLGFLKPFFTRKLLSENNIRYDETLKVGEDSLLIFDIFAAGATAYLIEDKGYHYYKSKNSISAVFDADRIKSLRDAFQGCYERNEDNLTYDQREAFKDLVKDLDMRLNAKLKFGDMKFGEILSAFKAFLKQKQERTYLYREFRHRMKKLILG